MTEINLNKQSEKALEYALNPPLNRIHEFTVIPKGSAMLLALQMAKFRLFDPTVHQYDEAGNLIRRVTLAEMAINIFFQLQRSVDGLLLKGTLDLSSFEVGGEDGYQDVWTQ